MILTNQERYGNNSPLQNKEILKKSKDTLMNNYGVNNPTESNIIMDKIKSTNIKKYGVENVKCVPEINEKIKVCMLERYGVENALQNDKIKEKYLNTMKNRYDVEYPIQNEEIYKKYIKTLINNYNIEHPLQSKIIYNNYIKTMQIRYGCENPMQNEDIFNKMQHNSLVKKLHSSNLYYQGSYEKDFLDKYFNKIKIEVGKSIRYNDNKIYYCDYYLPDYDLLVEIKSDYWYYMYEQKNIDKHNECIKLGHNHIFVINKDYTEIEKIINI